MILYSSFFIQDLLLEIKKQRTKYFLSNLMYHHSTLNVWGSGTLKAFDFVLTDIDGEILNQFF